MQNADSSAPMRLILRIATFFLLLSVMPGVRAGATPEPVHLKPALLESFERYVRLVDARNKGELGKGAPFLQVDSLPDERRAEAYAALRRGEVKIERLEARENGRKIETPGGLIHHWAGAVFIPGATLGETLALLQDYDHHEKYYAPDVQRSKILERDADHFRILLRFRRKKVITVVLNTEHDVHYFTDGARRAHSRSSATRIAEVEHHDEPGEREKPAGEDGGYLWRMETWWRMEERDAGTYVQSEVVSLTRNIPAGLGWLIGPFVHSIPRESLTFTLSATRDAVKKRQQERKSSRAEGAACRVPIYGPCRFTARNAEGRLWPTIFSSELRPAVFTTSNRCSSRRHTTSFSRNRWGWARTRISLE